MGEDAKILQHSNEAWLAAINGDEPSPMLDELRLYLTRALRRILSGRSDVSDDDLADFVQETQLRLVRKSHTFRGDSAFTTWATAVATRVAFTELRKRKSREDGLKRYEAAQLAAQDWANSPVEMDVEDHSSEPILLALREAIATKLTNKQRLLILSELKGVSSGELARQMNTNQNALYKLGHDARKKLKSAIAAAGFSTSEIQEFIAGAKG